MEGERRKPTIDAGDPEPVLETERLMLEPLLPEHAVEIASALGDPEIYRFIPQDPPTDVVALAARYARLASRQSPDGDELWLNWAVRSRASSRCLGRVEATVRKDDVAEIAYLFAPWARGAGYATEACRAMLGELVETYGVRRIEASFDVRNARSRALLERLGFRRERVIATAAMIRGESSDEEVYWWEPSTERP